MSDFSTRLKAERKRLGLSQVELGTAGGVSKDAQLNYESGSRSPNADYLQAIAAAGVDVFYLLNGSRQSADGLPLELNTLLHAYERTDDAGRATLQAVALLAIRASESLSDESKSKNGNTVTIGGDVGQSIAGDQSNTGPVSFSVGKHK